VKPVSKYFHVTPFSHSREGYIQAVSEIMTNLELRRPKIIIEYRAGTLPGLFQGAECPDSDLKFQDSWDTPEIKERKCGLSKEYRESFAEAGGGAAVYVRN
jgi:hypothetical protein